MACWQAVKEGIFHARNGIGVRDAGGESKNLRVCFSLCVFACECVFCFCWFGSLLPLLTDRAQKFRPPLLRGIHHIRYSPRTIPFEEVIL